MIDPTRPVAKALHTVTVLVQLARTLREQFGVPTNEGALDSAMTVLGLAGRPDPHGQRAAALKQLEA